MCSFLCGYSVAPGAFVCIGLSQHLDKQIRVTTDRPSTVVGTRHAGDAQLHRRRQIPLCPLRCMSLVRIAGPEVLASTYVVLHASEKPMSGPHAASVVQPQHSARTTVIQSVTLTSGALLWCMRSCGITPHHYAMLIRNYVQHY